jgi:hypothetical protein
MPEQTQYTVLESTGLSIAEIVVIQRWLDLCRGKADKDSVWTCWLFYGIVKESLDDYHYCYTPQLELTQHGQRMKDNAYRAQARA